MSDYRFVLASLTAVLLATSGCSKSPESVQIPIVEESPVAPVATPPYPDIESLSVLLNSGETNSVAIVADLIERAGQFDGLNAFITLDAAGAAEKAAQLDRQRASGEVLGPLHGIPLVVKDNIHVAGLPNTAGTPALKGFVPAASNEVVARLEAAGAIILGKTNLHELAFGITSDNTAFGAVGNPFDGNLFAGGSSGGTASAISAGLAPAGLGTDTGGSTRIPAALTGVVGFRPSSGRYPSGAVTPISHTRDTVGLLSRTVAGLIALDTAITADNGPDTAIPPADIRLGVPRAFFYENLDTEMAVVVEAVLATLAGARVQLVDTEIPGLDNLLTNSAFPIAVYEVKRELPAYLQQYATGITFEDLAAAVASPDVQGVMGAVMGEGGVPDEVYAVGLNAREQLRALFRDIFAEQQLDAIIFPTTPLPARPIAGSLETVELNGLQVPTFPTYIRNTDSASIAALPGISLPVGVTASGLPVGMEIDGPEQSDRRLMAVARVLEGIIGFKARPPRQAPEH